MVPPNRRAESIHRRTRRAPAPRIALLVGAAAAAALAAPVTPIVAPPRAHAQHYIATSDTAHPLVRYADSTVSLNDRCIVRQTGLAVRMRPVYVNGLPIGFC